MATKKPKKLTVAEGHQLISKFMTIYGESGKQCYWSSSWEWLMPVISKLKWAIHPGEYDFTYLDLTLTSVDVGRTFQRVCDAITWYNESKTK